MNRIFHNTLLSVCVSVSGKGIEGAVRGFRLCGNVCCCDYIAWLFLATAQTDTLTSRTAD